MGIMRGKLLPEHPVGSRYRVRQCTQLQTLCSRQQSAVLKLQRMLASVRLYRELASCCTTGLSIQTLKLSPTFSLKSNLPALILKLKGDFNVSRISGF